MLLAPDPEGLGLSAITALGVTAKLSCTTLQQLPAPLQKAVETVSAAGSRYRSELLEDFAGQRSHINGSYKQLCSWLQRLVPSLDKYGDQILVFDGLLFHLNLPHSNMFSSGCRLEICYLLLYLRCWDLRPSGSLGLALSRRALRHGIIWRVGSGRHFQSHPSNGESCGSFKGVCSQGTGESHELCSVGDENSIPSTRGRAGESLPATNSGPSSSPVPLDIHSPILSP